MIPPAYPLGPEVNNLALGLVDLPITGGFISVSPRFTMAVQPLTASTTSITVAGVGAVTILLSQQDTLNALRGI